MDTIQKMEQEFWVIVNDEGKVLNKDDTYCGEERLTYRNIFRDNLYNSVNIPFENALIISDKQLDDAKRYEEGLNYFTYRNNYRFQDAVSKGKLRKVKVTTIIEFLDDDPKI